MDVLTTNASLAPAFDPAIYPHPPHVKFTALWDTGATNSVITQRAVDALGLKPIGMTKVHGVSGETISEVFMVAIALPNSVGFCPIRVTKGSLGDNLDVLIGMDIISKGDFAVTNKGGVTVFSFRVPPMVHTDYVQEQKAAVVKMGMSHGGAARNKKSGRKRSGKGK